MPNKPFEIGERVRVYGACANASKVNLPYHECDESAVVMDTANQGWLRLRSRSYDLLAHEKQCRRLIKKKRERIWVGEYRGCQGYGSAWTVTLSTHPKPGWDEYVKVKK